MERKFEKTAGSWQFTLYVWLKYSVWFGNFKNLTIYVRRKGSASMFLVLDKYQILSVSSPCPRLHVETKNTYWRNLFFFQWRAY